MVSDSSGNNSIGDEINKINAMQSRNFEENYLPLIDEEEVFQKGKSSQRRKSREKGKGKGSKSVNNISLHQEEYQHIIKVDGATLISSTDESIDKLQQNRSGTFAKNGERTPMIQVEVQEDEEKKNHSIN